MRTQEVSVNRRGNVSALYHHAVSTRTRMSRNMFSKRHSHCFLRKTVSSTERARLREIVIRFNRIFPSARLSQPAEQYSRSNQRLTSVSSVLGLGCTFCARTDATWLSTSALG
jgi:hypothetical protein